MIGEHLLPGLHEKLLRDASTLEVGAPPQYTIVVAEPGKNLGHLGGVLKHIADKTNRHRFNAPLIRNTAAQQ